MVLCNPESGSIGKETKNILTKFGNYMEAMDNAAFLTTDSRNLTKAIAEGTADVCINWYATSMWAENKDKTDIIVIDEKYADKKKLVLNLLKSSKYPELTKKFMEYAASKEGGRKVFFMTTASLTIKTCKNLIRLDFNGSQSRQQKSFSSYSSLHLRVLLSDRHS